MTTRTDENFKTLAAELKRLCDNAPDFGCITLAAKLKAGVIVLTSSGIKRTVAKSQGTQGGRHA
jgi:hypothetical protein